MPLGDRDLYWGPGVQANLRSLGYLSRNHRCAYLQDVDKVMYCYYAGTLLFSAPMQSNYLYPFDTLSLAAHPLVDATCMLSDAEYWLTQPAPIASLRTGFPTAALDKLRALSSDSHNNLTGPSYYAIPRLPTAYPSS